MIKCKFCGRNLDEAGVMYNVGGSNYTVVCPTCFIVKERHGTVHVLFHWGLDDEKEAED